MLPIYLFCAAFGIPLLALFAFGGGSSDAEVGGFEMDADIGDVGDIGSDFDLDMSPGSGIGDATALFRRIPLSSYAFFLSFFGGIGVIGTWLDFGFVTTLILAVVLGVTAAAVNASMFAYLRKTDISSHMTDAALEGRLATVSVPIADGKRGRVWLDTGDERLQLTAGAIDHDLDEVFAPGDRVVIVQVDSGVAQVMRADPEIR